MPAPFGQLPLSSEGFSRPMPCAPTATPHTARDQCIMSPPKTHHCTHRRHRRSGKSAAPNTGSATHEQQRGGGVPCPPRRNVFLENSDRCSVVVRAGAVRHRDHRHQCGDVLFRGQMGHLVPAGLRQHEQYSQRFKKAGGGKKQRPQRGGGVLKTPVWELARGHRNKHTGHSHYLKEEVLKFL